MNLEELEYRLYHLNNVVSDLVELNGLNNRSSFLLKYNISSEQSQKIDSVFLDVVKKDKQISLYEFGVMLSNELFVDFSKEILNEMCEVYKDYQPLALSMIDYSLE
ncbi:hypothetical protein [Streptococcus suis]|uniref:Uncharacterized protein n=1 Tax=Streptococcus suis TaxID=1307 RepID=A0ACD4UIB6_STRSU